MITGTLKAQVNKLWEEFWTGGITNPLTVIEQISFLAFSRLLDMRESREERKWKHTKPGRAGEPFPGKLFSTDEEGQKLRWSHYRHMGKGDELLAHVRDKVFPHMKALGQDANGEATTFGRYMADAQLMIQRPSLMISTVEMIEKLPLGQADTKGDLYEYLLAKLTTAGINGQFRTPRHIIKMMVELVEPEPTWTIADPACGTGGFLVAVREYLRRQYTSPEGRVVETNADGDQEVTYSEDLLEPYKKHVEKDMFYGFDFDVTMLRIAAMNLMLHDVDQPNIAYQDTLSNSFSDKYPKLAQESFDLVLANPPFKGSLDHADVHSSLTGKVKTKKTELLFLILMLRMLKLGGKCAVIVPDGVLFGSSSAHQALRKVLVDEHQLDAVVKLLPVQGTRRSRDGGKTLRVSYDYHTVRVDYAPVLKVGKPPEDQPKTARRLRTRVRKGEVVNTVKVARKYQKFLERPDVLGYQQAAKKFGVSKPVVSMYMAILTRLPASFIEWLENCPDKLVLAFFSERRLRPVTKVEGEVEKVKALLGLLNQCLEELEEENQSLEKLRVVLGTDLTPSDSSGSSQPKGREFRGIQVD